MIGKAFLRVHTKEVAPKKITKKKTNHTQKKTTYIYIHIFPTFTSNSGHEKSVCKTLFFFPVDQIPARNFCLTAKNIILADNKLLLLFAAMFLCKFKPVSRSPLFFSNGSQIPNKRQLSTGLLCFAFSHVFAHKVKLIWRGSLEKTVFKK